MGASPWEPESWNVAELILPIAEGLEQEASAQETRGLDSLLELALHPLVTTRAFLPSGQKMCARSARTRDLCTPPFW